MGKLQLDMVFLSKTKPQMTKAQQFLQNLGCEGYYGMDAKGSKGGLIWTWRRGFKGESYTNHITLASFTD